MGSETNQKSEHTPLVDLITALWNEKPWEGGLEHLAEFVAEHIDSQGMIDRLTLATQVFDPRNPTCPAEIKLRLMPKEIVVVEVFFVEAPRVREAVPVPISAFHPSEVPAIAREVANNVLNNLMRRSTT